MRTRIRTILAAIGAIAVLGSMGGCILVEKGGHHGHCELPRGHWHGR